MLTLQIWLNQTMGICGSCFKKKKQAIITKKKIMAVSWFRSPTDSAKLPVNDAEFGKAIRISEFYPIDISKSCLLN